jgi:tetratricopeptide (TPR) repeat protein
LVLWPSESSFHRKAVGNLSQLLKSDGDRRVRSTSARSLGKLGDPKALAALLASYEQDEMILSQVVLALQDLGVSPSELERVLREGQEPRSRVIYREVVKPVKIWLTMIEIWRIALMMTGLVFAGMLVFSLWDYFRNKGKSLLSILLEKIPFGVFLFVGLAAAYVVILKIPTEQEKKPSAVAEVIAIELAKKLKDHSSVDWLCQALLDRQRNVKVRWLAAEALGVIGETRAFEPLSRALKEDEPEVRAYAAWAIGNILAKDDDKREDGFDLAALDKDDAEQITGLLEIRPNSGALFLMRSRAYSSSRQYDKALADLDRARVLAPRWLRAEVYNEEGWVHMLLKQSEQALPALRTAIALEPTQKLAYFRRALVLQDLGRWQEALSDLDKVLALNPNDGDALQARAIAYESLGRWTEARADLTAYLEIEAASLDREQIEAKIKALGRRVLAGR